MKKLILSLVIIFLLALSGSSFAGDVSYVSEWQYKLIVEENMVVKCTQVLSGKCASWNWIKKGENYLTRIPDGDYLELTESVTFPIVIQANEFFDNTGWIQDYSWMTTFEAGVNFGVDISDAPVLTYKLSVVVSGTYYIWLRGEGVDVSSDSVNYGINGAREATITFIDRPWSNYTQYTNIVATIELAAGDNILNIWMREDGVKIKEIRITDDPNYVPEVE